MDSLDGIDIISDSSDSRSPLAPELISTSDESTQFPKSIVNDAKADDENLLTCMFITANVGTIFEESDLLELWFKQLKCYLTKVRPQLVAIHCQEIGGKNYASSMRHVTDFTDKITGDESIICSYDKVRIFLDEDYQSLEKFTALGSIYLVHGSIKNVKLYNFKSAQFEAVEGREVHGFRSTNDVETIERVKFPQELFPECRPSRKGFMRTRFLFGDQVMDLVNIHLFHDASNLVAMKATPSPYAQNRQKALEFALKKVSEPLKNVRIEGKPQCEQSSQGKETDEIPLFIFGDFNFRLDTNKVIEKITEGALPEVKRSADSNEVLEFVYHRKPSMAGAKMMNSDKIGYQSDANENDIGGGGIVMTIGKKTFDYENLDETFRASKNTDWLKEMDNELESFKSQLYEFKISFSPSYPFKEDTSGAHSYMKTRCPAWCDRILFNAAGSKIIHGRTNLLASQADSESRLELLQSLGDVQYRLMGNSSPMGDHKPVLLYCRLNIDPNKNCCN